MYWVYAHVRDQERKMKKYAANAVAESGKQQKRIQNQAFMYVGAFLITWLFPTLFQLVIVIAGKFPFPLLLLTAIFVPIQGLLNLVVFIRPKFTRYKRANHDTNTVVAWFQMLYLEITGYVQGPSRTSEQGTSSQGRVPDRMKMTFRVSGLKPTVDDVVDEEKDAEDAKLEDDFEDNPNTVN
jgi:hypothetical protein